MGTDSPPDGTPRAFLLGTVPAEAVEQERAVPGLATGLLLAREAPPDAPGAEVVGWFEAPPPLELANGSDSAAVWCRDFAEVSDPPRLRAGFTEVGGSDPFARRRGGLQTQLKGRSIWFRAAVSFAPPVPPASRGARP